MAVAITFSVRTEPDGLSGSLRLGRSTPAPGRKGSLMAAGASLALLAPLVLAIGAAGAQRIGLAGPARVLSATDAGGVGAAILRAWVWAGPALAVVVSATALVRLTLSRVAAFAAEVTIRLGALGTLVFAVAVLLAAAFYGHLVADAVACSNGIRSAC